MASMGGRGCVALRCVSRRARVILSRWLSQLLHRWRHIVGLHTRVPVACFASQPRNTVRDVAKSSRQTHRPSKRASERAIQQLDSGLQASACVTLPLLDGARLSVLFLLPLCSCWSFAPNCSKVEAPRIRLESRACVRVTLPPGAPADHYCSGAISVPPRSECGRRQQLSLLHWCPRAQAQERDRDAISRPLHPDYEQLQHAGDATTRSVISSVHEVWGREGQLTQVHRETLSLRSRRRIERPRHYAHAGKLKQARQGSWDNSWRVFAHRQRVILRKDQLKMYTWTAMEHLALRARATRSATQRPWRRRTTPARPKT